MNQYSNMYARGEFLYRRYFDEENNDKVDKIQLKPWFFLHCEHETGIKDIYQKNVKRLDFNSVKEYRESKNLYIDAGQEVLGMDNLELLCIADMYPNDIQPNLDLIRIASIDIETVSKNGFPYPNEAKEEIDAISHIDSTTKEIWLFSTRKWESHKSTLNPEIVSRVKFRYFTEEKEMLLEYLNFWKQNYPHIVTGWNIDNYDIQYMMNRYNRLFGEKITKQFSPFGFVTSKLAEGSRPSDETPEKIFSIAGIAILDYLALYKKFRLIPRNSYKLDFIAEIELNENKLEYDGPLWQLAEEDPQKYCDYNIQDTLLIEKLDDKLKYLSLTCSLSYYAKINFEKVMSPVTTWDAIIFNSLLKDNIVVPMRRHHERETFVGAYVKEPKIGKKYGWVASYDLTSLYPSIIRQWNISPETIVGSTAYHSVEKYLSKSVSTHKEYIQAVNGQLYTKEKRGIIPIEIEKVFNQRKTAKNFEFMIKKVNEVFDLSIKLYDKIKNTDINLECWKFIGKTEGELYQIFDKYSKDDISLLYSSIEKDFAILNEFVE